MAHLPHAALALGVAGAIPFIALAPGPHSAVVDNALRMHGALTARDKARVQVAYGATILSFLGGIHWGLASAVVTGGAVASPSAALSLQYGWSVVPSLVAWPALLLDERHGAKVLAAAVAGALAVDLACAQRSLFPRWMIPMRIALSTCASMSLLATAFYADLDKQDSK